MLDPENNNPCFKLLTTSSSDAKDSDRNLDMKIHVMNNKLLVDVLVPYRATFLITKMVLF